MLAATADSHNNTSGNGQFGSLTRKRKGNKRNTNGFSIEDYSFLDRRDSRMRFNNSKDPIYYVFDCVENRPITTLAKEFVRDSFKDIVNFVSTVVA